MPNTEKLCMGCMKVMEEDSVCPVCGFNEAAYNEPNALPLRSTLAERYVVGKIVSANGEGQTYLGYDNVENKVVKIREYFPRDLTSRTVNGGIAVNVGSEEVFRSGLAKFIELYKKLATVSDGVSFFRILDIFETEKTAYCVSEFLPGITLKEFLIRNGGMLTWEQARPLFLPLVGALNELHSVGLVHGGISPETLIVGRDGRVRITDFAIAEIRSVGSAMTAQLYPGFAALEQYQSGEITPATDIYSFAATIFRTLTGTPPAEAIARLERDNLSFSKAVAEELPKGVLVALANALRLDPNARTHSMQGFKNDLASSDVTISQERAALLETENKNTAPSTKKYTIIAAIVTAVILIILGVVIFLITSKGPGDNDENSSSSTPSLPSVVSVGDIGNPSQPDPLFSVPDFTNMSYPEIMANDEYTKWFVFSVEKKEYNGSVERGKICGQSVAVGTSAKKETEIKLTISLGPKEVTLSNNLKNMTKEEAYVALLELGFTPANIEFVAKMGETETEEEVIIEALPTLGTKVSPDSSVILYYNTNLAQESSKPSSSDTSSNRGSNTTSN